MNSYLPSTKQNKDDLQTESFDFLLNQLSSNPEQAETRYLAIRNKLIIFFRSRGFSSVDVDLADKTIDRAARKLIKNAENTLDNSNEIKESAELNNKDLVNDEKSVSDSFFLSVAYFVLKEHQRTVKPTINVEDLTKITKPILLSPKNQEEKIIDEEELEMMLNCFNKCLNSFPIEKKLLLVEYFSVETTKSDFRQFLADKLNININALRVKAHRLRVDLINCVENCLKTVKSKKFM
jgi:hypothetical protein